MENLSSLIMILIAVGFWEPWTPLNGLNKNAPTQ